MKRALAFALSAAFLVGVGPAGRAETISFTPPVTYMIKDGPAQRTIGVQEGVLLHCALAATRTGQVRYLAGEEFIIGMDGRGLSASECRVLSAVHESPGELVLTLRPMNEDLRFTVTLHYLQRPGSFFMEKWIEIRPDSGSKSFISEVTLESFKPWEEPRVFHGRGQPVYVGDAFFGVEYPWSDNAVDGEGRVTCSYPVGLEIGPDGYVSRRSVYGLAEPGKVGLAFLDYVDRIRARPAEPFLLWNSWYDLFNYTDREVIESVAGLKERLTDPNGIRLDSVVLDDGWDDWFELWRPHRKRFPNGFSPVVEAVKGVGASLGLWMSPVGGYAVNLTRRLAGTLGRGYEKNPTGFCFAGRDYHAAFTSRMTEYEREYGVNYFKLDNLNTVCRNPIHGHRVGRYAQAGLTDAFIETLSAARSEEPGVMINFTVGSWLSPWWLMYADVLWRGGWDYGFKGAGDKREQSITYVDSVLYERLRKERAQFPVSSIMTHGIIKGGRQSFGETGENLRGFADDCWMYFGRGVAMQELYLTPAMLSDAEWKTLARAIRFSRENWETLKHSEMVLGDPAEGEVYGFVHVGAEKRIVVLRNPVGRIAPLSDDALNLLGVSGAGCSVVYSSTGQEASAPLDPLEARLISCPSLAGEPE